MTYPVYRKYQSGQEFHKVVGEEKVISVFTTRFGSRLLTTNNVMIIRDIMGEGVSMDCTEEEYKAAYDKAMAEIVLTNSIGQEEVPATQTNQ